MDIERSPARDAALDRVLPFVPEAGWTWRAFRRAGVAEGDLLFPGGPGEMIEAWGDLGDRRMALAAPTAGGAGVAARVRGLVARRLREMRGEKDAARLAAGWLALPGHQGVALRSLARTADAIWHAAGDRAADASWYSKRAILAGIYGATLLVWLGDRDPGEGRALAFLDRRLAGLRRFGAARARLPVLRVPAAAAGRIAGPPPG